LIKTKERKKKGQESSHMKQWNKKHGKKLDQRISGKTEWLLCEMTQWSGNVKRQDKEENKRQ